MPTREIPAALEPEAKPEERTALFDEAGVELQAAALLRFLTVNCATDGATYVLHRRASESDDTAQAEPVRLFDLTALCDQRQRKWKWLLATLSARFATRIAAHLRADDRVLDAATR